MDVKRVAQNEGEKEKEETIARRVQRMKQGDKSDSRR